LNKARAAVGWVWVVASGCVGAWAGGAATQISGVQSADIDPSVRPQDDLFLYANGTWLRTVPIPQDKSRYGVDVLMTEQSQRQQRQLIEGIGASSDPEARKVADLYAGFMDEAAVEKAGIEPLQPELQRVSAAMNLHDLSVLMAHFDRFGIRSPLSGSVNPDAKNSTVYAYWVGQGGLGLPDRDYYLSNDAKFAGFRHQYRRHIERMLQLLKDPQAGATATKLLALETKIAKAQWSRVAERDPQKTYNPQTLAQLGALAPAIDWRAYFAEAGLGQMLPTLVVREPAYFRELSKLVAQEPIPTWRAYFRFRLLSSASPYLPRAFVNESFAFNERILRGTPQIEDRWKRGCELVDAAIGEASGKMYVARYFPPESKARVDEMVANLLAAYADSIDTLQWMSAGTKTEALAKLRKLNVKVGYPKQWRDYDKLSIARDDLLGNWLRANNFETERKLHQLGGPIDRNEWEMTPPTVNAYYEPSLNEIVFPAGILQLPVFNPAADDAYNYGATGATIGHEMSHGFDDEGSQFDSDGNLRDWWTAEDHQKYKALTDMLVKEYGAFEPVPGFKINGELTLGENIADIAGLEMAYKAYIASLKGRAPPVIDGMSGETRFYLGYAQSWMTQQRADATIAQLKSDPHSPEKFRANGSVVHMPSFYAAFGVKSGDKMYLAPEHRVTLW
jgi:putative endopeptidase